MGIREVKYTFQLAVMLVTKFYKLSWHKKKGFNKCIIQIIFWSNYKHEGFPLKIQSSKEKSRTFLELITIWARLGIFYAVLLRC